MVRGDAAGVSVDSVILCGSLSRGVQIHVCSSGLEGRAFIAQGKAANGGRRPGLRFGYPEDSPERAR